MSDDRQQMEQERMALELEALHKVDQAGLHEEALFLAVELGLKTQFQQEAA